ncbi:MAG: NUDIX hydrolase [Candidatus Liptonbacteria bacterium]|nr:NUDIX hydrolase [Candidatus Liptonbacteria bacterium]
MLFKTPPSDFKKEIDVVGCYLEHEGKFVLLRREESKTHGGKWGLPAGKVHAGETIQAAMAREIKEETGVELEENKLHHLGSLAVRNNGHDLDYHMFTAKLAEKPEIQISPAEHRDFAWVSPAEALQSTHFYS